MAVESEHLARLLRRMLETGDPAPLVEAYADDAVLDLSVPGERSVLTGPDPIAERLTRLWPGPAELVEWTPACHLDGCAAWSERRGEDGVAARHRQYLRLRDGAVARHWLYCAPPRSTAPETVAGDPGAFDRLGAVAERTPLVSTGWSGNRIERVVLADGRTLIAKRVVPAADWIGRATRDEGREALLHRSGAFDRMPPAIDPPVVDAWPEGDGAWWVAMRDVSAHLLDHESMLPRERNRFVLASAAAMWEEFWNDDVPHASTLEDRLSMASRGVAERERNGLDLLPKQFDAAWAAFAEAIEPDVAEPVLRLLEEPAPLAAALDRHGSTLLHGDLRDENIGFADGRVIVLDWGLATRGHPVVDLAWYMVHDVWRIEATHDEVVEDFRCALGERDEALAVELGMIAGLVMYGWIFGHSAVVHPDPREREWARAELSWWVPRVRRALESWSP